jgi:hypothetical protein
MTDQPSPDRERRIPLAELRQQDLDLLYNDLDRYDDAIGELNETNINMARELAALRAVARGYCPHCGRGDAAPTVEDWEQQKQRADHAEAALEQVRDACDRLRRASVLADGQPHTDRERGVIQTVERVLAVLDESTPGPATAGPS